MWALDIGTTNSGIARWDEATGKARLLHLPGICRDPQAEDPLEAPRLVPTATHVLPGDDLWTRVGRWPVISSRMFLGRQALIGRPALEKNATRVHPAFVPTFKPYLGRDSLRTLARSGQTTFSAREVARSFLRELLAEVKNQTGERIRELAVTAPVDSYEAYRAEVRSLLNGLGVHRVRFVDEPVAAAAGYGVGMASKRTVLVVDFGGGTLDLALAVIDPRTVEEGSATVIGKAGRNIGGNLVDAWLLDAFCERLDYQLPESEDPGVTFWRRLMLAEARRVKELLFFRDHATFLLTPPEDMRSFHARVHGEDPHTNVSRDELMQFLADKGLYAALTDCTDEVLAQAAERGMDPDAVDDVLMVGGSTLLPGVFSSFEDRFGRDRVRAWQPFEAVVTGACALYSQGLQQSDFIVHDYAFVTYDQTTNERQYQIIVPHGTRFPTAATFWRRQLVPTCALGEPERIFKLVVAEVGRARAGEAAFGWDAEGKLRRLSQEDEAVVVPLNESNPTLGYLDPPHPPSDRRPRLDVAFGVNADRWLCTTVRDLKTNKVLLDNAPVVRLL